MDTMNGMESVKSTHKHTQPRQMASTWKYNIVKNNNHFCFVQRNQPDLLLCFMSYLINVLPSNYYGLCKCCCTQCFRCLFCLLNVTAWVCVCVCVILVVRFCCRGHLAVYYFKWFKREHITLHKCWIVISFMYRIIPTKT